MRSLLINHRGQIQDGVRIEPDKATLSMEIPPFLKRCHKKREQSHTNRRGQLNEPRQLESTGEVISFASSEKQRFSLKKLLDSCLPGLGKNFSGDYLFEEFK